MNNTAELLRGSDPAVTSSAAVLDARARADLKAILAQPRAEADPTPTDAVREPVRRRAFRPLTIVIGGIAAAALVVGGVSLVQPLSTPITSTGDWPWYDSGAALIERADLVVSGRLGDIRSETAQGITYGVAPFMVERVAKGGISPGTTIEVKFMGESSPSPAALQRGHRYVLFLETYPDSPASLLNPAQGAYEVSTDGAVAPRNGNTITLDDEVLARLQLHR